VGAEVQGLPAALPLDLIDLALAVVLATSLERERLRVPRKHRRSLSMSPTIMH
jgi:hypothetical protein